MLKWTPEGLQALENAEITGTKMQATHMALGDGGGQTPDHSGSTMLVNEMARFPIDKIDVVASASSPTGRVVEYWRSLSENWPETGVVWIREVAIYMNDVLVAIGSHPTLEKLGKDHPMGTLAHTVIATAAVSNEAVIGLWVDPMVHVTRDEMDKGLQALAENTFLSGELSGDPEFELPAGESHWLVWHAQGSTSGGQMAVTAVASNGSSYSGAIGIDLSPGDTFLSVIDVAQLPESGVCELRSQNDLDGTLSVGENIFFSVPDAGDKRLRVRLGGVEDGEQLILNSWHVYRVHRNFIPLLLDLAIKGDTFPGETGLATRAYVLERIAALSFNKTGGTVSQLARFPKGLSFENRALYAAKPTGKNANHDYIWHDDASDTWHLVSDAKEELGAEGNSALQLGRVLLGTRARIEPSGDKVRVITPHGCMDIGPYNTEYCHFKTCRDKFYFQKPVYVDGEIYTGPHYDKRCFHQGDESSDPSGSSEEKLATEKAVWLLYRQLAAITGEAGDEIDLADGSHVLEALQQLFVSKSQGLNLNMALIGGVLGVEE